MRLDPIGLVTLVLQASAVATFGAALSSECALADEAVVPLDAGAIERAMTSFDVDAKFAALVLVQRGVVKDIRNVIALYSEDDQHKQTINFLAAFDLGHGDELSRETCIAVNREWQKLVLGGYWKSSSDNEWLEEELPPDIALRGVPKYMQLSRLARRFSGYTADPFRSPNLSGQEYVALLQLYEPIYAEMIFDVSLARTEGLDEPKSVTCNNHEADAKASE